MKPDGMLVFMAVAAGIVWGLVTYGLFWHFFKKRFVFASLVACALVTAMCFLD